MISAFKAMPSGKRRQNVAARGGPGINQQKRHALWPFWAVVLVIILYAGVWVQLATPYRFFPSDDLRFWSHMSEGKLFHIETGFEPAAEFSMRGFSKLAKLFLPLTPSFLVIFTALCHSVTMAAIAFLAWRIGGDWFPAFMAVLLYALSAWPVTYLFAASYAPLETMFAWLSVVFVFCSPLGKWNRRIITVCAALAATACLGCSVSGAIAILGIAWLALAVRPPYRSGNLDLAIWFFAAVLIGIGLLWWKFGKDYQAHVTENLHSGHLDAAKAKFGAAPPVPIFSGVWVLWSYSKTLATVFVGSSLLILFAYLREVMKKGSRDASNRIRLVAILGIAIWLEIVAIDVLPTTKLARTHFLWFPALCLFIALAIQRAGSLWQGRPNNFAAIAAMVIVGVSATEAIPRSLDLRESRLAVPRELLNNHPGLKTLHVVYGDPHAWFLAKWLSDWQVTEISLQDLYNQITSDHTKEYLVLFGPSGPASGNSILSHGCLRDMDFSVEEFARQTGADIKTVPYFAFAPGFCMEEENCEGLLFGNRIPDPGKDPSKNVRVLHWPARPRAGL